MQYRCPVCDGRGYLEKTEAEHSPNCHGENCGEWCPIPVEVQEACQGCGGKCFVAYDWLIELINALDVTPLEKSEIIDQIVQEAERAVPDEAKGN